MLLSSAVLAAPLSRVQRRAASRLRKSGPLILADEEEPSISNASHVSYSSDWAGAVITAPPAGQTFKAVSAQVTVPTVTKPPGATSNGPWSASAWVGIDGDAAGNSILQTGIDITVTEGGAHSFAAWYEWYPNNSFDYGDFHMVAGDVISLSVVATSSSAGTATLKNISTGKSVSKAPTAPSKSANLAGKNAKWIVEDFQPGSSLVPFADFGSITFTNCVAKTGSKTLSLSSASLIDIKQGTTVKTDATIDNSSKLGVKYV